MNHYVIKADQTVTQIEPDAPENQYSLAFLQGVVGGLIQVVHMSVGDNIMIVNEEGALHDLPLNVTASLAVDQHIFGDVAIVPSASLR